VPDNSSHTDDEAGELVLDVRSQLGRQGADDEAGELVLDVRSQLGRQGADDEAGDRIKDKSATARLDDSQGTQQSLARDDYHLHPLSLLATALIIRAASTISKRNSNPLRTLEHVEIIGGPSTASHAPRDNSALAVPYPPAKMHASTTHLRLTARVQQREHRNPP
jgi:hypothetical protein